jgi:probable F420-dependent oxidoreductase
VSTTALPDGGALPEEFRHSLDPFVALASVAAVTERLLLGTAICLVVERDPIVLAKEVASLDVVSGGRVLFGVGAGWNRAEMANHGTDPRRRFTLLRERILAMKAIWTHDVAEFHGEQVDFGPLWQWPKPIQRPHPPVLIGGWGPGTFERVLDYGDGWLPGSLPDLDARIAELNRMGAARGRSCPVTVLGGQPDLRGLEAFRQAGVHRCVLWLPPAPAGEVLPILDRYAELAQKLSTSS